MVRVHDTRRALIAAIALGIALLPIQSYLGLWLGGAITVGLVESIINLGFKPHVSWMMRGSNAVIWSAIYGAILGIPLGLLVQTRILRYWFVLVAAAILTHAVLSLWSEYGASMILMTWSLPEYWLYFLGVLCFAYLAVCLQRRIAGTASVAP